VLALALAADRVQRRVRAADQTDQMEVIADDPRPRQLGADRLTVGVVAIDRGSTIQERWVEDLRIEEIADDDVVSTRADRDRWCADSARGAGAVRGAHDRVSSAAGDVLPDHARPGAERGRLLVERALRRDRVEVDEVHSSRASKDSGEREVVGVAGRRRSQHRHGGLRTV
jgi:hypothetical protein